MSQGTYELPGNGVYSINTITILYHEVLTNYQEKVSILNTPSTSFVIGKYELPGDSWYSDNMITILCHEVRTNYQEKVGILITQSPSCVTG